MGVEMSIFSILQFFIFIPIYCSQVYYVHVGFEYLFIHFIQEKNTVQNKQDIIKMFLYFHVSLFDYFFHVSRFYTVLHKNKITEFILLNDTAYFYESGSRM